MSPDTEWMDQAACAGVDPELFFGRFFARAKAVCSRCPVLAECRQYALSDPNHADGIWGGLTEHERAELRKQRGLSTFVGLSLRIYNEDSGHSVHLGRKL